jgi:hypothetical protein
MSCWALALWAQKGQLSPLIGSRCRDFLARFLSSCDGWASSRCLAAIEPTGIERDHGARPYRPSTYKPRDSSCPIRTSVAWRRWRRHRVEKGTVTTSEGVAIILKAFGWHGRIMESFMPLDDQRSSVGNILPGCLESILKALFGDGAKCRRWRRRRCWRLIIDRLGMRASNESERQQQRRWSQPCLHNITSSPDVPPLRARSYKHPWRTSVAIRLLPMPRRARGGR